MILSISISYAKPFNNSSTFYIFFQGSENYIL